VRIHQQFRPVLQLAVPLILAEVGWMCMGVVDTMMVGHMHRPVVAIAASGLGEVTYNTLAFAMAGVLLGLDAFLSQSHGAGRWDEANRWLWHGLVLAAGLTLVLSASVGVAPLLLTRLPIDRDVVAGATAVMRALNWGSPSLLLFFVVRRYMQAFNHVRPIAVALISANALNAALDWLLIFGHSWGRWSVPALGVFGSGLATSLARLYMVAFIVLMLLRLDKRHGYGVRRMSRVFEPERLRRLVSMGGAVGLQIFAEIAIFATVTYLCGVLGPLPLAAHEIALTCASFTFMVPLGISNAASVRVGQALGRGAVAEARAAGWASIALAAGVMLCFGTIMWTAAPAIAGIFTRDAVVIAAAVPLLWVAACFQLFDGLQIAATGALRGAGSTRAALVSQLLGYWVLGLPVAWWLAFGRHMGALGMWIGLCCGLVVAAVLLVSVWWRTTGDLGSRRLLMSAAGE
jgi:MATE family multidrug resistance protein